MLLPVFLMSALAWAADPIPERVSYSLDWWVGRAGEVTKIYDVRYEGPATLERLARFSDELGGENGEEKYVESILPNREATDTLVEKKKVGPAHYRWVFSGKKQDASENAKPSLVLRVPVVEDAVPQLWAGEKGSRFEYRLNPLEVRNRLVVRGPWEFQGGVTHKNDVLSEEGIEVRLVARRVTSADADEKRFAGYDLDGAEISETIVSSGGPMSQKTKAALNAKRQEWTMNRFSGGALAGIPRTSKSEVDGVAYRWGGGTEFGYYSNQFDGETFGGWDLGFAVALNRRFTRALAWQPFAFNFSYGWGSQPATGDQRAQKFGNFRLAAGTLGQLRAAFYAGPAENKLLNTLELEAGPMAVQNFFSDDASGAALSRLAPAAVLGFRWGMSSPKAAFLAEFGLAARYTSYFVNGAMTSDFSILLENRL